MVTTFFAFWQSKTEKKKYLNYKITKNEKWNGLKCLIVQLSGGIELAKFWKPKWDFEINHENWKNPTGEETLNSYIRLHILAW